jgi:HEAT repeat protein
LKDNDSETRKNAAESLRTLAGNPTNKDAIREAHGIPPLVALLNDNDSAAKHNAAGALIMLAADNVKNQTSIAENVSLLQLEALAATDDNISRVLAACRSSPPPSLDNQM